MNIFGKQSNLPFFRHEEKSMVSFTHEQNIICSQTQLDDIVHGQTIICRQLFAGHVVGFWPMKRKENLHWMIIVVTTLLKPIFLTFALIIALIIHELGLGDKGNWESTSWYNVALTSCNTEVFDNFGLYSVLMEFFSVPCRQSKHMSRMSGAISLQSARWKLILYTPYMYLLLMTTVHVQCIILITQRWPHLNTCWIFCFVKFILSENFTAKIITNMNAPSPLFLLLNKINNNLEVAHPLSGYSSTCTWFLVELEFGSVDYWQEGKNGLPGEKPLRARERTNNKLNLHMASTLGFELGPHDDNTWC